MRRESQAADIEFGRQLQERLRAGANGPGLALSQDECQRFLIFVHKYRPRRRGERAGTVNDALEKDGRLSQVGYFCVLRELAFNEKVEAAVSATMQVSNSSRSYVFKARSSAPKEVMDRFLMPDQCKAQIDLMLGLPVASIPADLGDKDIKHWYRVALREIGCAFLVDTTERDIWEPENIARYLWPPAEGCIPTDAEIKAVTMWLRLGFHLLDVIDPIDRAAPAGI